MATATATRFKPVTLEAPDYAVSMTAEVFRNIFGVEPQDIHAEIETCGAWGLPVTFKAPAIHWHWKDKGYGNTIVATTFYGKRSLYKLRQQGSYLEGRCKVEGGEVDGWTSDIMVDVGGQLCNIAVISIRSDS
jgi:hypothetical protein